MRQQIKTIFRSYGTIVRPWLCVVAYLWILALQSVYGTDFEPVIDGLADAASILWTLNLWVAIIAAFISLSALGLPPSSVCGANEFVCRIGCILVSGFYLMRWLARWPSLGGGGYAVHLGIILVTLGMYFLARLQRGRLVGAGFDDLPTWCDCFSYAVVPLLIASVAVLGIRIGAAFVARMEVPIASSNLTLPNQLNPVSPPNLIVIVADSLRAQSLSLYGASGVVTPTIEQFGKAGSVYLNTHANATMTTTSLTALLTGKHLLHHGRLSRDLPAYPSDQNLLQILRSHGYATAAVTSSVEATVNFLGFAAGLSKAEKFAFSMLALGWLRDLGIYPTRLGGRMYQDLRLLFPLARFTQKDISLWKYK